MVDAFLPGDPVGALSPGAMLGSYRLERLLGRGGMGTVFLATDTTLHRPVALKVLTGPSGDASPRSRLVREARTSAALVHSNICTIYEVGDAHGCAFIAMEFVEGRSLRERLDKGPLPVEEVLRLGVEVADALAYAHVHGVVHRDFKAANVMLKSAADSNSTRLTQDRLEGGSLVTDATSCTVKIVDFGLAQRADTLIATSTTLASLVPAGAVAGTPYAMAPEQVRGEVADARTDIWAIGVLLYEMVAGARPFSAPGVPELLSSILRDAPRALPRSVPVDLRVVIEQCLEKDPERRYQLASDVRDALDMIQAGAAPTLASWRYLLKRRRGFVLAAAAVTAAAVLASLNVGGVRDRLVGRYEPTPIKMVVLPFENLTGSPDQEYFSDGLTDEIITQLGRLNPQRLRVVARTSSMRYKKRDVPVDQIGRELNVDYVLEGSARSEGNRVRVSATLVRARDQTQQWADSFERELSGILVVQGDVAVGVAKSLAVSLLPDVQTRLSSARPVNPDAYTAYLKGRSFWDKATPQDLETAEGFFQLATEKDPAYALPYTGISAIWIAREHLGYTSYRDAYPKAKAAALKAVQLDDLLPEAHEALATVLTYLDWDWAGGAREFGRAIALSPACSSWRLNYVDSLIVLNQGDQAVTEADRCLRDDPFNLFGQQERAMALVYIRRYADGVDGYERILRIDPNYMLAHANLSWAFFLERDFTRALEANKKWAAAVGDTALSDALTRGAANGAYSGAMRSAAQMLVSRSKSSFVQPVQVAVFFLFSGDTEGTLDWLQRAYDEHDSQMTYLNVDPQYDPIRHDTRFQDLLGRMHFPK